MGEKSAVDDAYSVMVVDDSAVIRGLLTRILEEDTELRVEASADDGMMALAQAARGDFDVIVLDIEMPVMDGLTALPQLIRAAPHTKIIMASTLTQKNAEITFKALAMGASDYVAKPSSSREIQNGGLFKQELIMKVKALAEASRRSRYRVGGQEAPLPNRRPFAAELRRGPQRQHFAPAAAPRYQRQVYQAPPPAHELGEMPPGAHMVESTHPTPLAAAPPAVAPQQSPVMPHPAAHSAPPPASEQVRPKAETKFGAKPDHAGQLPSAAQAKPTVPHQPPAPASRPQPVVQQQPPAHRPRLGAPAHSAVTLPTRVTRAFERPEVVAIGSSTGGPQALFEVLPHLAGLALPVLITQHMPPTFTAILADHIARQCRVLCAEAKDGEPVVAGRVYLAPGDHHMTVVRRGGQVTIALNQGPPENFCRPAVDPMLRSLVAAFGGHVLVSILTGMGQDGLRGSEAVRAAGGVVMAQDEPTSVVWGMPGAVAMAGVAEVVLPLAEIGPNIRKLASRTAA
jgi:two-component system, chemotaxis family, protein-glutamate methylesterase/glutaminase